MALQLSNFKFCVTNYTFSYPEKADQDYKDKHDPEKVSLKGFVVYPDGKKLSCYLKDDFASFGLTKEELISKLNSDCVISGSGLCKLVLILPIKLTKSRARDHTIRIQLWD